MIAGGFNSNYQWRFACYKCDTIRSDLDSYKRTLSRRDQTILEIKVKSKMWNDEEKNFKELGYIYLDWQNSWNTTPVEVKKCDKLKHEKQDNSYSVTGSRNLVKCNTCKYYYHYDCS